jgi:hypothetical protein
MKCFIKRKGDGIKFIVGTVVRINNLSKSSWYLYKKYLDQSPLLICPCHVKREVPLIVLDHFNNGIVLLQVKNSTALTMTFANDLRAIYEPNI